LGLQNQVSKFKPKDGKLACDRSLHGQRSEQRKEQVMTKTDQGRSSLNDSNKVSRQVVSSTRPAKANRNLSSLALDLQGLVSRLKMTDEEVAGDHSRRCQTAKACENLTWLASDLEALASKLTVTDAELAGDRSRHGQSAKACEDLSCLALDLQNLVSRLKTSGVELAGDLPRQGPSARVCEDLSSVASDLQSLVSQLKGEDAGARQGITAPSRSSYSRTPPQQ